MQIYQGIVVESQTAQQTQYRVPLFLQISQTPLYIRVTCPANFPQQRPTVQVLARVFHKDLHDVTKVVASPLLDQWNYQTGSSLVNAIRDIHSRFDRQPPVPEKMQMTRTSSKEQQ